MSRNDDFPLISVIINCYNGERFLREAIESVLGQTYKKWELILWDNHSTDRSADLFFQYSDRRMRYIYPQRWTCLGSARNSAIEWANGTWIAFLDCDDVWLPDKMIKSVELIKRADKSLALVYSETSIIFEKKFNKHGFFKRELDGTVINPNPPSGRIFEQMLSRNWIPLVSAIIRLSAIKELGGINTDYKQAEDYELFLRISRDYQIAAIQEVTSRYRIHETNLTHSHMDESYLESIEAVRACTNGSLRSRYIKRWNAKYATFFIKKKKFGAAIRYLIETKSLAALFHILWIEKIIGLLTERKRRTTV